MIAITGAAGFIGSCLAGRFNEAGYEELILADDFSRQEKEKNYSSKKFREKIHRDEFPGWLDKNASKVEFVFHIGARTDTTEFDKTVFDKLNLNYSKQIWNICTKRHLPLVYASSAATYGDGENGYEDAHELLHKLKPLNPYSESKHQFDLWAISRVEQPPFWAGLKFFNVYGPNEYHKGRMASVVFHAFNQINKTGKLKLFRSHRDDFEDGMQLRDFIYVKDIIEICYFLYINKPQSGIYNAGTGKARTFLDLGNAVFKAMNKPAQIEFIDIPEDIRGKYQYFTEAKMEKLEGQGYNSAFRSIEAGVEDYVAGYLKKKTHY